MARMPAVSRASRVTPPVVARSWREALRTAASTWLATSLCASARPIASETPTSPANANDSATEAVMTPIEESSVADSRTAVAVIPVAPSPSMNAPIFAEI
jgi:hypothetical protein